jgi:hypothetical protein
MMIYQENFLNGGGGYIGYWLRFNPFCQVLYCDNGEGVIPLCWCEFAPHSYRGQDGAISYEGCAWALERCENF